MRSPLRAFRAIRPVRGRALVLAALALLSLVSSLPAVGGPAPMPLDIPAFYPEGPTTDGRDLFWAEMPLDRIRRLTDGAVTTVWQRPGCGPTAVKRTPGGEYWVLCHLDHRILKLGADFHTLVDVATDAQGRRIIHPNDGVVDGRGRLYFSSSGPFSLQVPPSGVVLTADDQGNVTPLTGPLRYPNGVTLARDGRHLLVSEHLNRRILEIPIRGLAAGEPPRVFFDFAKEGIRPPAYPLAGPDGLTVIPSGQIVVAEYGAGRIIFISPAGRLLHVEPVPMTFVTNFAVYPPRPGWLVVVGAFENDTAEMRGRVISIPIPPFPQAPGRG